MGRLASAPRAGRLHDALVGALHGRNGAVRSAHYVAGVIFVGRPRLAVTTSRARLALDKTGTAKAQQHLFQIFGRYLNSLSEGLYGGGTTDRRGLGEGASRVEQRASG